MVLFHRDQIVAARVDDLLAKVALAEHCIADGHATIQHQIPQELHCGFMLVGSSSLGR
jgi:hypothetical protein